MVTHKVAPHAGPICAGARELLDSLTRSEADRATLIGRLAQRDHAAWLAEMLTDLEVDEVARLYMTEALRRVVG